jgi:hypothetical protein
VDPISLRRHPIRDSASPGDVHSDPRPVKKRLDRTEDFVSPSSVDHGRIILKHIAKLGVMEGTRARNVKSL